MSVVDARVDAAAEDDVFVTSMGVFESTPAQLEHWPAHKKFEGSEAKVVETLCVPDGGLTKWAIWVLI